MKRHLVLILLATPVLASVLWVSCGEQLQTFSRYGMSFKVSKDLKLEEYTVRIRDQFFQKGMASYEEGVVMSTEKNFVFLWLRGPEFTREEVRLSILSTPNTFESRSGAFQAKIDGDLTTQRIANFQVTFADMQFTLPGWGAPGITAVWYCPSSQRTVQLIVIHKQPKNELERFMRSFSCE